MFAVGWPVSCMAVLTCGAAAVQLRRQGLAAMQFESVRIITVISAVWMLLLLTGKNSGEAARLWLLFCPWLVWIASSLNSSVQQTGQNRSEDERTTWLMLVLQYAVCLLTATRVDGFHIDGG